jgi:pimeloyl-ACP methyl ester carboxylesterase
MYLRIFTLVAAMLLPLVSQAAPPPGVPDGRSDGYFFADGARLHYYHAVPAEGQAVIVMAHAVVMLDPGLPSAGRGAGPGAGRGAGREAAGRGGQSAPPAPPLQASAAPANLSINMFGSPEVLVAQNNYNFDDLAATCGRNTPKWDLVDCQYWALSKIQYHGPYTDTQRQALSGPMRTGNVLAQISVPVLVLKADASPEARESDLARASVIQNGRLVHIDGAGHNLYHDELERTVEVMTEFLSEL